MTNAPTGQPGTPAVPPTPATGYTQPGTNLSAPATPSPVTAVVKTASTVAQQAREQVGRAAVTNHAKIDATVDKLGALLQRQTGRAYDQQLGTAKRWTDKGIDAIATPVRRTRLLCSVRLGPAVFFLPDGAPTDVEAEWKAAFAQLTEFDKASGTDSRMYPNTIPFGLQGADPRILQEVIHPKNPPERAMRLFMADQDQTAASAVTKMTKLLVTSVIQSSTGLAAGSNGIILPQAEDGVKSYAADDDVFL